MSALIYPRSIAVQGNPAQHGLADLALVVDSNSPTGLHIVITSGQLVQLYKDIAAKLSRLPFVLVTEEVSQ